MGDNTQTRKAEELMNAAARVQLWRSSLKAEPCSSTHLQADNHRSEKLRGS